MGFQCFLQIEFIFFKMLKLIVAASLSKANLNSGSKGWVDGRLTFLSLIASNFSARTLDWSQFHGSMLAGKDYQPLEFALSPRNLEAALSFELDGGNHLQPKLLGVLQFYLDSLDWLLIEYYLLLMLCPLTLPRLKMGYQGKTYLRYSQLPLNLF